jgi:hypothetical protein
LLRIILQYITVYFDKHLGKILTGFEPAGIRFSKEVSSFQVIAYFQKWKLLAP